MYCETNSSKIVSFVIWLLFKRKTLSIRPAHLLCHGLQQPVPTGIEGPDITTASSIPGVFSVSPNDNVAFLKGQPWNDLLAHLKTGGDHIMINLLLDCGVFVPVDAKGGNYLQVSGAPIFMVNSQFHISGGAAKGKTHPSAVSGPFNTPSSIRFVRSRMFYARCTLNSAGGVRFGLRHIHVFNRYPNASDASQTAHVMKYMFPRQHGLHNAFTSRVDPKETAMPFKDYTLREHEIKRWEMNQPFKPKTGDKPPTPKLPKRLRGSCFDIVRQVRKRHRKCSYVELLRHYCPAPLSDGSSKMINQAGDGDIVESATPAAHVSAFCRSVMRTVFPRSFFGDPGTDAAAHNETHVNVFVDNFISLRKFESLALHDLLEGLKVSSIPWLRSPKSKATERIAKSDFEARKSLLAEAMYFLIDGYLIPLIRSNFHVTESNNHRNRLFYFRHDIWRAISEPAMLELKSNLFEELLPDTAKSGTLTRRTATTAELRTMSQTKSMLCYSQIRLLPKSSGFRMITNLRRRMPIRQGGRLVLGKSINSFLTPAFNVMNYEKASQSVRLGASLFSVNDIFTRLKEFKSQLQDENLFGRPLYFAKVDVKSCFDTIPQDKAMQLIESLLSSEEYSVGKYAELKAADSHAYDSHGRSSAQGDSAHTKPRAKFASYGKAAEGAPDFKAIVASDLAATKRNTVFTRAGAPVIENRLRTLAVLREHITRNVVKIGKKRYRQKTGIPQGSVVSALLCNFFYGKFEHDRLAWLTGRSDTLLMRLIDDFLVVGTEKNAVERFVSEMHCGDADFGVQVKQEKTLMNFEMQPDEGAAGGKVWKEHAFPYCGLSIDSRSLGVRKDYENKGSKGKMKARAQSQSTYLQRQLCTILSQWSTRSSWGVHSIVNVSSTWTITLYSGPFHGLTDRLSQRVEDPAAYYAARHILQFLTNSTFESLSGILIRCEQVLCICHEPPGF